MDTKTISGLHKKGLIHTHNIEYAKKYLTDMHLEYYYAAYIYFQAINKNYEEELITLFEQFKKEYPSSKYTHFIESEIIPIISFHRKQSEPGNGNISFIIDSDNINSLKEATKELKGERIYVDVWATWCGPCKAEFEHKTELKNLLAEKNVELLYISIDHDEYEAQWKDMIKFYDLEGYHIRANKELGNDLRKIFDRNGSLSIPWYILIDEKGKIIKTHASGPSRLKELEKEINEM